MRPALTVLLQCVIAPDTKLLLATRRAALLSMASQLRLFMFPSVALVHVAIV